MIVLGLDAGKTNFGLGVVELSGSKYKIHGTRIVKNTIKDAKLAQQQATAFRKELVDINKKFKFDYIVAERFQTRGIKGTTIEFISMMLGALLVNTKTPIKLVTASTWKNQYNKNLDLNELYADLKEYNKDIPTKDRKTPHELDACLMAMYGYSFHKKLPFYEFCKTMKQEKKLLNTFLVSSDI